MSSLHFPFSRLLSWDQLRATDFAFGGLLAYNGPLVPYGLALPVSIAIDDLHRSLVEDGDSYLLPSSLSSATNT